MPPLLYLFALVSAFLAACLAEVVTIRPPQGKALVERAEPPVFRPPISDSKPDLTQDLDLLDTVLVASVDGKFHALNRTSGHKLWSMSSFATTTSVSAPSALGPLVRTSHVDFDPDVDDEQELYIIEPQTGDIYVMSSSNSPLQLFPFSMSELVDLSPFSLPGDETGRVFVGRKETSLVVLELETGKIKATISAECPWIPSDEPLDDEEVDLDELEGSKPQVSAPTEIYIGRTDYHISIYSQAPTRRSNTPQLPIQNLSFSTYGPNNKDNYLQSFYRRTKDNMYVHSLPNGEVLSFKTKSPNDNSGSQISGSEMWGSSFSAPIVAVFDILRNDTTTYSGGQHTFVLLQPRPSLNEIIHDLSRNPGSSRPPHSDSAFVGMVTETGSLYAMSPNRFPLVAFGSTDGSTKGRLIDSSVAPDNGQNDPTGVDEITRARKARQQAESRDWVDCNSKPGDRRCLTGHRVMEGGGRESRARRLLDGPMGESFHTVSSKQDSEEQDGAGINESRRDPAPSGAEESTEKPKATKWEATAISMLVGIASIYMAFKKFRSKISPKLVTDTTPSPSKIEVIEATPIDKAISPPEVTPTPAEIPRRNSVEEKKEQFSVDEGEDSERDVEGEGDPTATPGKRKNRRGKRGKKKKVMIVPPDGNEDGDGEKQELNGSPKPVIVDPVSPPATPGLVFESSPKPVTTNASTSLVVSDTILGFGSHGTVVYQGSLQGRAVAVKRLLQDFVTLAAREVTILQESDDHPNVIRYYYQEAQGNFLYIALELCPASLADIVETPDRDQWRDIAISFDPKRALKQITSGLKHLHALKLVHRDIKPQNILVTTAKGVSSNGKPNYRMLISDFGLCKKLDVDQTSFLPTAHGAMAAGTVGWRAPEILRGEVKLDDVGDDSSLSSRGSVSTVNGNSPPSTGKPTRLTKSVDIFALGCLFYYTLTSGGHPFGDRFEREVNIMKNASSLDGLLRFGEEGTEAVDLITKMLNPEASLRPDTTTCLLHPFFWDPGRRLNFLQDASDRFEIMCRDPKDPNLLVLEKDAFNIVGNDWQSRLDKVFLENLGKFRKYDKKSVQDLLRALRNKKHHYQDLPDYVKRHLGPMPEGFLSYFTRRYPKLFMHVHSVIKDTGLRSESMFRSYFELPDS